MLIPTGAATGRAPAAYPAPRPVQHSAAWAKTCRGSRSSPVPVFLTVARLEAGNCKLPAPNQVGTGQGKTGRAELREPSMMPRPKRARGGVLEWGAGTGRCEAASARPVVASVGMSTGVPRVGRAPHPVRCGAERGSHRVGASQQRGINEGSRNSPVRSSPHLRPPGWKQAALGLYPWSFAPRQ